MVVGSAAWADGATASASGRANRPATRARILRRMDGTSVSWQGRAHALVPGVRRAEEVRWYDTLLGALPLEAVP
ncbi:hypothetical protein Srubr_42360 [Streptomyces rubradiris]|uniref:Uncharacterized protein n=1 Tax=Streptomyces rubradiris TaxID=285531 RepID=A0ABQ3REW3_STRRR|nr:hypothetical protein Srubr_42360 [Streptomyces rubradiris]